MNGEIMKKIWRATCAVALTLTFAVAGVRGQERNLQDLERNGSKTFIDGVESYIYGYPPLMFGVTERTATTVPDDHTRLGSAPLNQFGKEMVLPDSSFDAVV